MADMPLTFRKEQIDRFVADLRDISSFEDATGNIVNDEFIAIVAEEVEAHEADMSNARVVILEYIAKGLAKDHLDHYFNTLSRKFAPIANEVVAIETKIFGAPKYVIEPINENQDASSTTPQQSFNVFLSPEVTKMMGDVTADQSPTNFVKEDPVAEFESLTYDEKAKEVNANRNSFGNCKDIKDVYFEEDGEENKLSIAEMEEAAELLWLEDFEAEGVYTFLEHLFDLLNKPRQISIYVIRDLINHLTSKNMLGERNLDILRFEEFAKVPDSRGMNGEVITARAASFVMLFTMLELTGGGVDAWDIYLDKALEEEKHLEWEIIFDNIENSDIVAQQVLIELIDNRVDHVIAYVAAKFIGRLPILKEDVVAFKLLLDYITHDRLGQLENAFIEMKHYYSYHRFVSSALVMDELIAYTLERVEATKPVVEEEAPENAYIVEDDANAITDVEAKVVASTSEADKPVVKFEEPDDSLDEFIR